ADDRLRGDHNAERLRNAVALALDPFDQLLCGLAVIEADVELRAGLRWDHIAGAIADIDGGEGERRGLEMPRPLVEAMFAQARDERRERGNRILGRARITDMALSAAHRDADSQRASAPDLERVAGPGRRARLADHAVIDGFTPLLQPVENLCCPVDG